MKLLPPQDPVLRGERARLPPAHAWVGAVRRAGLLNSLVMGQSVAEASGSTERQE